MTGRSDDRSHHSEATVAGAVKPVAERTPMTGAEPPTAPTVSDHELVARIARGDRDAFEVLFRAHYAALIGFADRLVRSRDVAEDTVQEVLLNVWRHRETLHVEESVRAYLYRGVRNRALNHLRNERVRRDAVPHLVRERSPGPGLDADLIAEEVDRAARDAVAALPPRCREVFELSRVHGLKYAEIAATLGISVKTVETQMGRALKSLRERLADFL